MWIAGALVGVVVGALLHPAGWIAGGIAGAAMGWMVGRVRRDLSGDRLTAVERRLERIEAQLAAAPPRHRPVEAEPPASIEVAPSPHPPTPEPIQPILARAPAPPRDVEVSEPAPLLPSPGHLEDSAVWRWVAGGNTIVRVGVVILFFGIAFLLKYAHDHAHVPIELRLTAAAAAAAVLLVFGWRLREQRPGYALALQGGGIGVLYLVIFAAFRLHGLLSPVPAFALLVAVAALSAAIAVVQDARSLAVLGASGGFLAPILASTGGGSHVALFGFYAVLNAGILTIAWFKAWRVLNLVGFTFTFAIGTLWGISYYRPEHFRTTEPFLVLFFLLYLAIPILFARRRAAGLEQYVDATLVFGLPLVAFGLQVALVGERAFGAAWSALALSTTYLLLARAVFARVGEGLRLLAETFLALGVVFGTLAIPLALDGHWTSAAWALEGAAIVWAGVRQRRLPARVFGLMLQFLAGAVFLGGPRWPASAPPIANSAYLGYVFLAVAGLFCAWYLDRSNRGVTGPEKLAARVLFGWGLAWWTAGALREIELQVPAAYRVHTALVVLTVSCAALSLLHARLGWAVARHPALAVTPLMIAAAAATVLEQPHPLAHVGYVAWPLAFAWHVVLLRRHEVEGSRYQYWAHAAGVWLLAALGSWEIGWGIDQLVVGRAVWPLIGWALVPGGLLTLLALRGTRIAWPVAAHRGAYMEAGAAPIAAFLGIWALVVNFVSNGDPAPLPYVPVLNPLDLAQLGAGLAIALWLLEVRRLARPERVGASPPRGGEIAVAAAFVWANAVLLRAIHHWAGVSLEPEALLRSELVQTALSIFWALSALMSMAMSTQRGLRIGWLAGAGLMAAVVAKLFLVDLSNVGTVQRIVSFIGVGVLMLVVGYLSPVPPRAPEEAR